MLVQQAKTDAGIGVYDRRDCYLGEEHEDGIDDAFPDDRATEHAGNRDGEANRCLCVSEVDHASSVARRDLRRRMAQGHTEPLAYRILHTPQLTQLSARPLAVDRQLPRGM